MSPLQQQYPLSPRKFWKKYIGKLIFWVGVLVFFLGFYGLILVVNSTENVTPDWANSIVFATTTILAALIVLGLFLYAWYLRVYIRRYYYDAEDHFVTIRKGVFAPAEIHVMYQKIQDVYVDQDVLDRIMGLYDVHLASATATSGMEAHIDGVEYAAAEGLKNLLLGKTRTDGGAQTNASATATSAPAASQNSVQLSADVSSKTYPLGQQWVLLRVVGSVISSLLLSAIISIWIFAPGKGATESFASLLGLSSGLWTGAWIPFFIVIFACHFIGILWWRATYSFAFLPEHIMMRSGLISRSEVHVPYRAVQDVTVTQGVIERFFGLATVNIQNAAQGQMVGRKFVQSGIQIPGQTLEKANHIAEITRSVTLLKNTAQTGL